VHNAPVVTHVLRAELPIPEVLEGSHRAPLDVHLQRLKKAVDDGDRPLIVGSAKELVEATARIVLEARGDQPASDEDFDVALNSAHSKLLFQRGDSIAVHDRVRDAGTNAKKLASQLGPLRNAYGTGHGRATIPAIEDEVLETCVDGALLWTRWALRRLGPYIKTAVQPLINDLHDEIWYSGDLAERLEAVDLPTLGKEDQKRIGIAVGQRSSQNTYTVWRDGVEACVNSTDLTSWPPAYREGLIEGLFLNRDGEVQVGNTEADSIEWAAQLLVRHDDRTEILTRLRKKIHNAAWSRYNKAAIKTAYEAMLHRTHDFDTDRKAQRAWSGVTNYFVELVRDERKAGTGT
jgi:hypothetical protein